MLYASIIAFLKTSGEQSEAEIAKALQQPIKLIQGHISQLSSAGEGNFCQNTRPNHRKKNEGASCPLSFNFPPPAPGPTPRPQRQPAQQNQHPFLLFFRAP